MTIRFVGRVGGLAAALGAGVVIGLAASAHASAEPTDSARGGSAGPAASVRSASAPRPAAAVRRNVGTASARPAAAAKARANHGVPAAAAKPSARREARPAAGVPAATVATTSVPAAAAAKSVLGWGDPRGRLITIYKGTHFAIPNSFGFFIKQVTGTGTFTPNTVYDLGDSDQYDWNKFTGIAFTPLQPDKNSAMVGWRYNLNSQEFEIAPFYNVDKKRILPNEQTEVISVPSDQTFTYTVDYTGITISYGGTTIFKAYPEGLTPKVWSAARVSGWFGGNEVAPRTVSYYLKLDR